MDSKSGTNIQIEPLPPDSGLKCPLCVDSLVSPRTLICLHTFCERCLELYITDMRASTRDGVITALFCPLCKQSFTSENMNHSAREIVAELPLNKLMDNTTSEFPVPGLKNWRKDKKKFVYYPQLCGLCSENNLKVKATAYCHGCGDFRCRHCSSKHKTDKFLTDLDHDVVDIEEMSPVTASKLSEAINRYTVCRVHTDNELKFYCRDHELLLCRDCDVTAHMKCRLADDFEGLSTSLTQLKETDKLRDEMEALQDDLGFMVETLRDNNNDILKQSQAVSSKVHSMKETIVQLFEELEESATTTITRSREHVAKQNAGKAFKMKQIMSAIEGSCSLLDSVSEHGTHRQLFTVFQKLKLQLQTYIGLINQERDTLVKTTIVMDIDHDLESLISGFDKVGEVRLENNKVDFARRVIRRKKEDRILEESSRPKDFDDPKDSPRSQRDFQQQHLSKNDHASNSRSNSKNLNSTILSPRPVDSMSEKETQTDLDIRTSTAPSSEQSYSKARDKKNAETQMKQQETSEHSDSVTNKQRPENHAIKKPQSEMLLENTQGSDKLKPASKSESKSESKQSTGVNSNNADFVTLQFQNSTSRRQTNADNPAHMNNPGTGDQSSMLPVSVTLSQTESEVSIMMDIQANLIQTKELIQDNPNRTRLCIGLCTLKDAVILMFKVTKRTGISFNVVALDMETLNELKSIEIKKEPRDLIAYESRRFAVTFPDLGFIDFFSFKPQSAIGKSKKRTKKAPSPADVWPEKSVKCDIRSAVVCKYRKGEFALSTSNYFATLSHEGTLTKCFYYSMSLRSVETDFWRTQLSVVKLIFDHKNDVIYAATSKPYKLFAFTVFGDVLSETVLDATVTSLQLDRCCNVYVCYNNVEDEVGRICRVVTKMDAQRGVTIDIQNPRFVSFSLKNNSFHVVENQSGMTKVQRYELDLPANDDSTEQGETDSIKTDEA